MDTRHSVNVLYRKAVKCSSCIECSCPVDFSEPSRRALRYASTIARWHESELVVLHMEDLLLHAAAIEAGGNPELTESHYQDLRDFIDAAGGRNRKVRVHVATGRRSRAFWNMRHANGRI